MFKRNPILNLLLLLALGSYAYFALNNKLLPLKYQLILAGALLLLSLLALLLKNRIVKILLLVIVGALCFGQFYSQDIINQFFLSQDGENPLIQDDHNKETHTLSLVVMKKNENKGDYFLKTAKYVTTDDLEEDLYQGVYQTLSIDNSIPDITQQVDYYQAYEDIFYDRKDVMIMETSALADLERVYPNFLDNTAVIKTLDIELIKQPRKMVSDPINESFTILLSGSDARAGEFENSNRNDVNIIAFINPKIHEIKLLSLPRDTYIPLRCQYNSYDKLTHAGNFGEDCRIESIEQMLDVDINYTMQVTFDTFKDLVNLFDKKLPVFNPFAFIGDNGTHEASYFYEEGCLLLDGDMALTYVRTRYTLPNGDFDRQENQKRVINSLIKQIQKPKNIIKFGSIFKIIKDGSETDIDAQLVNKLINNQIAEWHDWSTSSFNLEGTASYDYTFSFPYQLLYVFKPYDYSLENLVQNIDDFMNQEVPSSELIANNNQEPENLVVDDQNTIDSNSNIEENISEDTNNSDLESNSNDSSKNEYYNSGDNSSIEENSNLYTPAQYIGDKKGQIISPVNLSNAFSKEEYINACYNLN